MKEAIKNFPKQFLYEPKIENIKNLKKYNKFIVCGMGGSALSAGLFKIADPNFDIIIHKDYALPKIKKEDLKFRLVIASSYSGETEETISSLEEAVRKKLPVAVISTGGKLIELAQKYKLPHVILPNTGIQPRTALGLSLRAMAKIMHQEKILKETFDLSSYLNSSIYEKEGKKLAKIINNKIALIYSSNNNSPIGYIWKIKINETGKSPAFNNVLPESNHNEINGFEIKSFAKQFHCILLKDTNDHPRVTKRMGILKKLYEDKGVNVKIFELAGKSQWQKIFSSILIADWSSFYLAEGYGLDPEAVPIIQNLKKMLK
jgi:glucose/mannose-6-phosphate isomerase